MAAEQDSDLALLEAWTTGDEAAGNQLLKRHFRTLFRFFRNKVSDSVDDLVQQTMMACAESVHRFRGESSFRTYLLAIARGQLLMHLRRYARKGKPIDQLETSVAALLDSPSSILAAKDEHEVLAAALRNIPLELQMTLELYYWEDLSTNEIGTIMEIPPGTVKSRLHRGRRLVKEWIEKQAELQPGLRAVTMQTVEAWRE